jgi:hypothetical protein
MESIITTGRATEYMNSFLNYKPRGTLIQHLRDAHSFYHLDPNFVQSKGINMFEYGFVDDTRPSVTETLLDVQLLGNQMIQNGQGELIKYNFDTYVNLVIKAAITKLENVDTQSMKNILSSSSEVFEILFGHLFNFDNQEISLSV